MISHLWQLCLIVLMLAGLVCTMIGLITCVQWFRTPKAPNDDSNRINNIMSWWIGLTRPDVMGKAYKAFRQDVMDNINDVEGSDES
jgi:hypothetical protein